MNDKEAIKRLKEVIEDCTSGEDEPYKEAFGMAILALEEKLSGGWIPVSERLPEIDDYYLTTWQGYHSIEPVTRFNRFSCGRFAVDGIKAWQPLPEPYKEVEDD